MAFIMNLDELKKIITEKIALVESSSFSLTSSVSASKQIELIVAHYADVFRAIWGDGEANTESYIHKLQTDSSKADLDFYLNKVNTLYKKIKALSIDPAVKGVMLTKISEHCDIGLLKQFEQQRMNDEAYKRLVKNLLPKTYANTVEIKSWGTTKDIGTTGFRNILHQQLSGGGVFGHVSTTMRIKADDDGKKLIEKYCRDVGGNIKIPYELKRYGNELIFEVYWSFWPGRLQTAKNDIAMEHSTSEQQADVALFAEMPLELKNHYLTQKYVKEKNVPLLGSIVKPDKKEIFEPEVPGYRIIALAPAATLDASVIEQDEFRRNYLELKAKQYTLQEEINALKTLKFNYFVNGKPYSLEQFGKGESSKTIKKGANLLTLLKRFHHQLSKPQIAADILLKREISKNQIDPFVKSINALIATKTEEQKKTIEELQEAATLLSDSTHRIHELKQQQAELQLLIQNYNIILNKMKKIIALLKRARGSSPNAYRLKPEDYLLFDVGELSERSEFNDLAHKINALRYISELTPDKINSLFNKINSAYRKLTEKSKDNASKVSVLTAEIEKLYSDKGAEQTLSLESGLQRITDQLEQNSLQQQQLEEIQLRYTARFKGEEWSKTIFKYNNHIGEQVEKKINSQADIYRIQELLLKRSQYLNKARSAYLAQFTRVQLGISSVSADALDDLRIQRGTSNNAFLTGFDIEKMLQKASEIVGSDNEFLLLSENCSSTSMKLLQAGATQETKGLFEWHEVKEGEKAASNRFITNPQEVYSAAKIAELSAQGDPVGLKLLKETLQKKQDPKYNTFLNQLLTSTMASDSENPTPANKEFKFSWNLLLKFLPFIVNMYTDIIKKTTLQETRSESVHEKVLNSIKSINGGAYLLISVTHPSLAIYQMCDELKSDPEKIPFFKTATLAEVERYILSIESKIEPSRQEIRLLETYYKIIIEREDRIHCVEKAVIAGENISEALNQRDSNSHTLNWEMTQEEKNTAFLQVLQADYQEIRNRKALSFLTPNFLNQLNLKDNEPRQLEHIIKHVMQDPNSRMAKAMHQCLTRYPCFKDLVPPQLVKENEANLLQAEFINKLSSAVRSIDIKHMMSTNASLFSEEEKQQILAYDKKLAKTKTINRAIQNIFWGGYELSASGGYKKIEVGFEEAQKQFEEQVQVISAQILKSCKALQNGETLYLDSGWNGDIPSDIGLNKLPLKIKIVRNKGKFDITYPDASRQSNALIVSVPAKKLLSEQGLTYFNKVLRQDTCVGFAEAKSNAVKRSRSGIDNVLNYFINESKAVPSKGDLLAGFINRVSKWFVKQFNVHALLRKRKEGQAYEERFNTLTSIAEPGSPARFDSEMPPLGTETYSKVRKAVLMEQRKAIMVEQGEQNKSPSLENTSTELLSPKEHTDAIISEDSLKIIDHRIAQLSVNIRYLNKESERLERASYKEALSNVSLDDFKKANIAHFLTDLGLNEFLIIELPINGIPKEVSLNTFYQLITANEQALIDPTVNKILDYLRTLSPRMERNYLRNVSPAQSKAFERQLERDIVETKVRVSQGLEQIAEYGQNIDQLLEQHTRALETLTLKMEQDTPRAIHRSSLERDNTQLKINLMQKDIARLQQLKNLVAIKSAALVLNGADKIPGKLLQSEHELEQIKQGNSSDSASIKKILSSYKKGHALLTEIAIELKDTIHELKEVAIQSRKKLRTAEISQYRKEMMLKNLQINPEYLILSELALGALGTKKDKDRNLYNIRTKAKEDTSSYNENSVMFKIRTLNEHLKDQVQHRLEQDLIARTRRVSSREGIESLIDLDNEYSDIMTQARELSKQSIPQDIKEEWVNELFKIWLQHEDDSVLNAMAQLDETKSVDEINHAFHRFIQKHTDIKLAALHDAGFPVMLSISQLTQLNWKEESSVRSLFAAQATAYKAAQKSKIYKAYQAYKQRSKKEGDADQLSIITPQDLPIVPEALVRQDRVVSTYKKLALDATFLSQEEQNAIDASTLTLLRSLIPNEDASQKNYQQYIDGISSNLAKLVLHQGLENKKERLLELCFSVSSTLLELPVSSKATLATELANTLIGVYRDSEGSLNQSFLTLENNERAQLLSSLIKLSMSTWSVGDETQKASVSPEYYSIIKQWERLIIPKDEALSHRIALLTPDGSQPHDIKLYQEADLAIRLSSIGLEGLYEGEQGLHHALLTYGHEAGLNAELRQQADRLFMRNGNELLVSQLIQHYAKPSMLYSEEGINSTQGREQYSRAYLDAYQQADEEGRAQLIAFVNTINPPSKEQVGRLKVPHEVFRDELLIQSALLDLQLGIDVDSARFTSNGVSINEFITSLTGVDCVRGEDRLFGFAKEINTLALQIEYNRLLGNTEALEPLYARLICSRLAYQSIWEQTTEELRDNLHQNFEYKKEMALVQVNINKLQEQLVDFSNTLLDGPRAELFNTIFSEYQAAQKFDGPVLQIANPKPSDIPGFIVLGENRSLDVLHGAIYVGNNKQGVMPAYIQSHVALDELKINRLPFRSEGGGYVYTENGQIKVSITPVADGSLIIQRRLKTIGGNKEKLQYLSSTQVASLPVSVKSRLGAEHFFIDPKGHIHAFSADFTPLMRIGQVKDGWVGTIIDHQSQPVSIQLANESQSVLIQALSAFCSYEELLEVDQNTVYIPSLKKYVLHEADTKRYFLADTLSGIGSRQQLIIQENGVAYTEKVLSIEEQDKVEQIQTELSELRHNKSSISSNGLLAKQRKNRLQNEIEHKEAAIRTIKAPEYFVFAPESDFIKEQRMHCELLKANMEKAYRDSVDSNSSKEHVERYEEAKASYLLSSRQLKKNLAEANYQIVYKVEKDASLIPTDFQSILYLEHIAGADSFLVKFLGAQIPQKPLLPRELAQLHAARTDYEEREFLSAQEAKVLSMLIGIELQHHLLEREQSVQGLIRDWNRARYESLKESFSLQIKSLHDSVGMRAVDDFMGLWRVIQSEFAEDEALQHIMNSSYSADAVEPVRAAPLNINTKTTSMPIDAIDAASLIRFSPYRTEDDLHIDETQRELERQLNALGKSESFGPSIQEQTEGFYYENYGLFHKDTLTRLFRITNNTPGVGGLAQSELDNLFEWLQQQSWIGEAVVPGSFQLTQHPSVFFSSPKLSAYLKEQGLAAKDISKISKRLEVFFYETAVNGGKYSIAANAKEELKNKIASAREHYNVEMVQAEDKIASLLANAEPPISMADVYSAYLLNDYSRVLLHFPVEQQMPMKIALHNALTRLLYYKTELDHLNDVNEVLVKGKEEQAIALLHIRRNYSLDKLLSSSADKTGSTQDSAVEQECKMQRAFLLFESEFGHRCNARQAEIFRGLLLDDEHDPDKIDAAQARMGFGKTSLLPLIALYKTGDKLVRFVVPKSALESNTAKISSMLGSLVGTRAIQDDFRRYHIADDLPGAQSEDSARLLSLLDAKADLQKRLALYKRAQQNREILVQAPHVRNAIECQLEVFLKLLLSSSGDIRQKNELMTCISLINEIRSLTTVTIFDELDATQDPNATEVNYTSGKEEAILSSSVHPLHLIAATISANKKENTRQLALLLLDQFGIKDADDKILNYVLSIEEDEPVSVTIEHSSEIYLIRGVLTDPGLLSMFTEKQPGTDFGVWFQNSSTGARVYDYSAEKADDFGASAPLTPLLIAIPYSAANTPKPQGSRFDNPEVTASATFLYYLDSRTIIEEVPHLEFLINAFRTRDIQAALVDAKGQILPEFESFVTEIRAIAAIEETVARNEARTQYFNTHFFGSGKEAETFQSAFRTLLARVIVKEQVKFDKEKANSNRYEQGTIHDELIGFSGTAGDTSAHFKHNKPDPAADGTMTLGIMGRKECQDTIALKDIQTSDEESDYTQLLITQLSQSFNSNTRALIDAGGLCKASNKGVAKTIALLLTKTQPNNQGVIFYDDVTNMQKVLSLDANSNEVIQDLSDEMMKRSDNEGCYFTYYDQDHSRGADIKQMDEAHALVTLSFTVTNNDYKQAIMRMRKIVDKTAGQSFSVVVPEALRKTINADLDRDSEHQLSGNDVAFWLRKKELLNDINPASAMSMEYDSVIKNAVLQQQAEITHLLYSQYGADLTEEQIELFRSGITQLDNVSNLMMRSVNDLRIKYGQSFKLQNRDIFMKDLEKSFKDRLSDVFREVNKTRKTLLLPALDIEEAEQPYVAMKNNILRKRGDLLPAQLISHVSKEATSVTQAESASQSQSASTNQKQNQAQSHSVAKVANERAIGSLYIQKPELSPQAVSIDFLDHEEHLAALPHASETIPISHIFKSNDPISCSNAYVQNTPAPSIRYFIARQQGTPRVLLLSQEEANLFKKNDNEQWSLYDLRSIALEAPTPLTGPAVLLPNDILLKKLAFATYRYSVQGNDLHSISDSLMGICEPEQLAPSLAISISNASDQSAQENPLFHFNKWGFSGSERQDLSVLIEPTQEVFKDRFVKKGVTIHVGQGESSARLFISSNLNQRILSERALGRKNGLSNPLVIKKVQKDIKNEYSTVLSKKSKCKADIRVLNERKQEINKVYDQKATNLLNKRTARIEAAKEKLAAAFKEHASLMLDVRKTMSRQLRYDFLVDSSMQGLELIIDRKKPVKFPSVQDALDAKCSELINRFLSQDQSEVVNIQGLKDELTHYIPALVNAIEVRHFRNSHYERKNTTCVSALKASIDEQLALGPNNKKYGFANLKVWDQTISNLIDNHFLVVLNEGRQIPDLKNRLLSGFKSAVEACYISGNSDSLEENLSQQFNAMGLSDDLKNQLLIKLCYTMYLGRTDEENADIVKKEIQNNIVQMMQFRFNKALSLTTPLMLDEVNRLLNAHLDERPFQMPIKLMDPSLSMEDRQKIINLMSSSQGLRTTEYHTTQVSQSYSELQAQHELIVQQIFEPYTKTDPRPSTFVDLDGKQHELPAGYLKVISQLDEEVLEIDRAIKETKKEKQTLLTDINNKLSHLTDYFKALLSSLKELKGLKSACNKLFSSLQQVFPVLSQHKITVDAKEPAKFLEECFDLDEVIQSEQTTEIKCTFEPPELYQMMNDVQAQKEMMHGLLSVEEQNASRLDKMLDVIKEEVTTVKPRAYMINGVLVHEEAPQQVVADSPNDSLDDTYAPLVKKVTEFTFPEKPKLIKDFGRFQFFRSTTPERSPRTAEQSPRTEKDNELESPFGNSESLFHERGEEMGLDDVNKQPPHKTDAEDETSTPAP